MLDLEAIRTRVDAATPGVWSWKGQDVHDPPEMYDDERGHLAVGEDFEDWVLWANGLHTDGFLNCSDADAEFIAHARTDVPALLVEVVRLTEENETLRGPHDAYQENGEPLLPRGWVPVDGGYLDELEAAAIERDALRAALTDIVVMHVPFKVEVLLDPDDEWETEIDCCRECGHDYEDETVVFRVWPCPTYERARAALGEQT